MFPHETSAWSKCGAEVFSDFRPYLINQTGRDKVFKPDWVTVYKLVILDVKFMHYEQFISAVIVEVDAWVDLLANKTLVIQFHECS